MTATNAEPDPRRGVYAISVAAELVGLGSQTLRLYEHRGLLEPSRSPGGTRRYSSEDLQRLRRIADLVASGVNLNGVALVLDLQDANARLQADLDTSRQPAIATSTAHDPFDGGRQTTPDTSETDRTGG